MNESIGQVFAQLRQNRGESRNAMTHSKELEGRLTGEGLRKIENDERIPRVPTIRVLARYFNLGARRTRELEQLALEKQAQRLAEQAGHSKVSIKVAGRPVRRLTTAPTDKKKEAVIRAAVAEMTELVNKFGVLDADVDYFRKFARGTLYKHLSS